MILQCYNRLTGVCNRKFRKYILLGSVIQMKKDEMGGARRVARMGRRGMHVGYWWESQKERDHWEDQDVDG
jgi:hypothetical protein